MAGPEYGAGRAGDAAHAVRGDGGDGYGPPGVDMGMGGAYGGDDGGYHDAGMGQARGGAGDSDSDEDLDEEALRIREGLADAPQMQRVQYVLHKYVEKRRDRIMAQLREKKEDAERLKKAREDTGVELYGVQQQLAKLQGELDSAYKSAEAIYRVRTKVEADREEFRKGIRLRRQQLQEQQAKLEEFASKLEGIHDTLRQAGKLNEEVEAEVALKRRTAYKAEEEAGKAEKAKSEQDEMIDVLNGRIQRLGEQVALYDGQIRAQKEETAAAEATLLEATKEMEVVSREKARLLQEWKSTVLEQQRRDEALGETLKAIREQEEAYYSLDAEEGNCRKRIREAQQEHAKLSAVLEREQSQIEYCIRALEEAARKREEVVQRQEILQGSLDSADAEVDRLVKESEGLRRQLREADGKKDLVEKRIRDADAGIEEDENAQVTARKAARNLSRDARKIMELVRQKEQELAGIENEMERIQLDKLHRAAHAEGLKVELQKAEEEVKEKEALAARYQMEIRQRNDAIEKKMSTMDRLNRKYEKLVAALPEEEHMGPLHAAIHNTGKQIAQVRQETEDLQKRWLQEQTSMVSAASKIEDMTAKERELKTQRMLLDRKRIRLEKEVEAQRREAAELRAGIERMREDMTRISELVSKNEALSKKLREGAYASESDFAEELKEAEKAFVEAERKVAQVKEARAELLEDTLECERQAAALEKKITLEKELQAALDPSVGQGEIAQMNKEIHRMKLRLEELQREQRKLLHEIERAVSKREDIATKFAATGGAKAAAKGVKGGKKKAGGLTLGGGTARGGTKKGGAAARLMGGHGAGLTLGEAKKAAKGKKKEVKTKRRELQGYRAAVEEKEGEKSKAEQEAARRMGEVEGLEKQCDERQADVNSLLYDRQREVEKAEAMQAMAAALRAAADGTRAPLGESEEDFEAVERAVDEAEQEVAEVRALLEEVQSAHPDMGGLLDRVTYLLEIVT